MIVRDADQAAVKHPMRGPGEGKSIAYDLPAFTTYDAALGVGKDAWLVQAYAENLTDTRAELYANYAQWYKAIRVSRPRTIGLRLSYKFGSS